MRIVQFTLVFLLLLTRSVGVLAQNNTEKTIQQAKGLWIGDKVANFSAETQSGEKFDLDSALKKGPVVVVFFRGQWCPYCNKHLRDLQDSLHLLTEKGATLVAISPERPEALKESVTKTNAEFELLFDKNSEIAKAFDVNYEPNGSEKMIYNLFMGAKLKSSHNSENSFLPIAATFIVNDQKKVTWRHFTPNHKERSSVKDIIKALN